MTRKPFSCPETDQPCTNPDCSVSRCVDRLRNEPIRQEVAAKQARAAEERKLDALIANIHNLTLDDLD